MSKINMHKFINGLLYFSKKLLEKNEELKITKFLKLSYFSDFEHFKKYGKPIFNDDYIRLPNGPVPTVIKNIIDDMADLSGECTEYYKKDDNINLLNFFNVEKRPNPFDEKNDLKVIKHKKEPDMDFFSENEIDILNNVLNNYGSKTATELIVLTHEQKPWINAKDTGNPISYIDILDEEDADIFEYLNFLEEEGYAIKK